MTEKYRKRIYGSYVDSRATKLAPNTLAGLSPREPYLRRLIQQHFPGDRQSIIKDLGCGHGAVVHFARQAGYTNVVGIDRSLVQVAAARRLKIEGVKEGDITEALGDMAGGSQDCIVMFDVVEHFTRDELIDLVDDVFRVLKPGGRWIIHTANGESPFAGRIRYGDLTHELAFTQNSIAQLLYSSGFVEVKSYEDDPVPHGLKSGIRWLLWKLIRGLLRLYLAVETGNSGRDAVFTQNFLTVARKI